MLIVSLSESPKTMEPLCLQTLEEEVGFGCNKVPCHSKNSVFFCAAMHPCSWLHFGGHLKGPLKQGGRTGPGP